MLLALCQYVGFFLNNSLLSGLSKSRCLTLLPSRETASLEADCIKMQLPQKRAAHRPCACAARQHPRPAIPPIRLHTFCN